MAREPQRIRRRERKNITAGVAHVNASFNNTMITITALLPIGSEPVLYGLLRLNPGIFWPAIFVATAGNTLGGAFDWWLGYGAHKVADRYSHSKHHTRVIEWLERLGPKACLMSWLPLVGDPLCAVAGWLRLPFWPCLFYMLVGKFMRYLIMTAVLVYFF